MSRTDETGAFGPDVAACDHAIRHLVQRYAIAVDAKRWDLFDELFTESVIADYSTARWESLAAWKADFAAFHERFTSTQHVVGGVSWHPTGGGVSAFTYVVARLIRRGEPGGDYAEAGAWYDDRIVATPAGPRIARRVCRTMWIGGNTALLGEDRRQAPWHSVATAAAAGQVGYLATLPPAVAPERTDHRSG